MKEQWIIPCNLKVYDIISHFKANNRVVWKNSFTIQTGDFAYIYVGRPYSEIKYKCKVVNDKIDDEKLECNQYAIPKKKSNNYFSKKEKYIELELIREYPSRTFPLDELREHGLGQVQIQARVDRHLQPYLDATEKALAD